MVNVLLTRVIALLLQMNLTVAGINYCQIVEYVSFRWVTIQLLADVENVFKYSNDSSLSGGFAFVFINKNTILFHSTIYICILIIHAFENKQKQYIFIGNQRGMSVKKEHLSFFNG